MTKVNKNKKNTKPESKIEDQQEVVERKWFMYPNNMLAIVANILAGAAILISIISLTTSSKLAGTSNQIALQNSYLNVEINQDSIVDFDVIEDATLSMAGTMYGENGERLYSVIQFALNLQKKNNSGDIKDIYLATFEDELINLVNINLDDICAPNEYKIAEIEDGELPKIKVYKFVNIDETQNYLMYESDDKYNIAVQYNNNKFQVYEKIMSQGIFRNYFVFVGTAHDVQIVMVLYDFEQNKYLIVPQKQLFNHEIYESLGIVSEAEKKDMIYAIKNEFHEIKSVVQ